MKTSAHPATQAPVRRRMAPAQTTPDRASPAARRPTWIARRNGKDEKEKTPSAATRSDFLKENVASWLPSST